MKNYSATLCLLVCFWSAHAMEPARRLAQGSSALVPFVRQHAGLMSSGALAAAGCATVYNWLCKPSKIDASVQTDGVTPQQITEWLDAIVLKANEFQERRDIIANLLQVQDDLGKAKKTSDVKVIEAYEEAEKFLIQQRESYNLLMLPSWQALKACSLPLRVTSLLNSNVVILNEALQSCPNDADFKTKFGSFTKFSLEKKETSQTLQECCEDFATYVATIKQDILS